MRKSEDAISRLQDWFASMCNNDWEHTSQAIEIKSIDNPGWAIDIDFTYTHLEGLNIPKTDFNLEHENEWYTYKVENGKFISACGPKMLNALLLAFLDIVENNNA